MIKFQWDDGKAAANLRKHGVSFEEATSVFHDDCAIQFFDKGHSEIEDRFIMLGISTHARVLVVCHGESHDGSVIRIISARKATARERTFYVRSLP